VPLIANATGSCVLPSSFYHGLSNELDRRLQVWPTLFLFLRDSVLLGLLLAYTSPLLVCTGGDAPSLHAQGTTVLLLPLLCLRVGEFICVDRRAFAFSEFLPLSEILHSSSKSFI